MSAETQVEEGTGNVFADLGFEDADEELAKALLSRAIEQAIERAGLTQAEAARRFGTQQPDVSRIVRGATGGFTLERLARYLTLLDQDVVISVRPKAAGRSRGRLLVDV